MAQFIAFTSEQPCIIPLIVGSCMLCLSVCKVVHGHRLGLYVALYRYNIQYCNNILYSIICVYYTVLSSVHGPWACVTGREKVCFK